MKIDARVTFLINADKVTLEVMDHDSRVTFLRIEMTPEQYCATAGGRLGYAPVKEAEVFRLDRVGLMLEQKPFEFVVAEDTIHLRNPDARDAAARKRAREECPPGWDPMLYFGSKDSFRWEDGKLIAKTIMERWVPKEKPDGE